MLTTVVATVVTGAVAVAGLVLSVWSSQRRRAVRQEATALRMDPGLVIAFIGAVALIYGLGDLVFLLLTLG